MEMNMPVTPAMYGAGNGLFNNGNDWLGFIFLAMIFGWGGNGFGFGGRGAGAGVLATDSLISDEFNFNTLNNGIRGLERGLCDLGYSLAQQEGQTREAIASSTFALDKGITSLGSQMAQCCCDTNRNIDALRYESAKNTCDIITNANMNTRDLIEAGNANTQRIIDMMTQNVIQDLRDKNTALTLQVSQQAQSANIIDSLKPCPRPAYIVQNPCCSGY
jgi:hypothetical protein